VLDILNEKAVTLIETIIVIFLLSLLTSLCLFVQKSAWDKINLSNTALLLQSDLRFIQNRSIVEGQYYEFRFDINSNRYRIYKGSQRVKIVKFAPGINYCYVSLGSDIFLPNLRFYPNGAPSSGGTIALENREKEKIYIIVTPAVGRVRISIKK